MPTKKGAQKAPPNSKSKPDPGDVPGPSHIKPKNDTTIVAAVLEVSESK